MDGKACGEWTLGFSGVVYTQWAKWRGWIKHSVCGVDGIWKHGLPSNAECYFLVQQALVTRQVRLKPLVPCFRKKRLLEKTGLATVSHRRGPAVS